MLKVLVLPLIDGEVALYRLLELWEEVLVGHQHDVIDVGEAKCHRFAFIDDGEDARVDLILREVQCRSHSGAEH